MNNVGGRSPSITYDFGSNESLKEPSKVIMQK